MKILILSCNTGEGHNSAGKALKYYFEKNGDECYMADAISFRSETISKIVADGHVFIYTKTPKVFDIVYNGAEIFAKKETSRHDSVIFKLLAKGADKLYEYILEHGFDRIVCFHPFASQMLTKVFRDHEQLREIPSYLIATDYTASPGAGESKVDVYVTPHKDVEYEFVRRGVPKAKIVPIGIPINPIYTNLPTRESARESLSLSGEDKVILLMSGSMGCGPIAKIAGRLTARMDSDTTLVIVCGRNEKLYRELLPLASENDKVRLLGFTDKLPLYMKAADLMLTKPGGLSSTEAACAGLPMVLIDAVAGCETYNMNFFVGGGYALTSDTPDGLVRTTLDLLSDSERLSGMREKLLSNFSADTAHRIYELVKEGRVK
ncbi:MAG: glycosyltransferase [Clostridia bacterium]|nr:glycosyltransferase [Clostridia bacterium]